MELKDYYNHPDNQNPTEISSYGTKIWRNSAGQYHREGDKPAFIGSNGTVVYYKEGMRHRDGDKPAYIGCDGSVFYFKEDKIHREGDNSQSKPAVIYSNGLVEYHENGEHIRDEKITQEEAKAIYDEAVSSIGHESSDEKEIEHPKLEIKPIFERGKSELVLFPDIDKSEDQWKLIETWKMITPDMFSKKEEIKQELLNKIEDHNDLFKPMSLYSRADSQAYLFSRAGVLLKLIKVANRLDALGFHSEADMLDELLSK